MSGISLSVNETPNCSFAVWPKLLRQDLSIQAISRDSKSVEGRADCKPDLVVPPCAQLIPVEGKDPCLGRCYLSSLQGKDGCRSLNLHRDTSVVFTLSRPDFFWQLRDVFIVALCTLAHSSAVILCQSQHEVSTRRRSLSSLTECLSWRISRMSRTRAFIPSL